MNQRRAFTGCAGLSAIVGAMVCLMLSGGTAIGQPDETPHVHRASLREVQKYMQEFKRERWRELSYKHLDARNLTGAARDNCHSVLVDAVAEEFGIESAVPQGWVQLTTGLQPFAEYPRDKLSSIRVSEPYVQPTYMPQTVTVDGNAFFLKAYFYSGVRDWREKGLRPMRGELLNEFRDRVWRDIAVSDEIWAKARERVMSLTDCRFVVESMFAEAPPPDTESVEDLVYACMLLNFQPHMAGDDTPRRGHSYRISDGGRDILIHINDTPELADRARITVFWVGDAAYKVFVTRKETGPAASKQFRQSILASVIHGLKAAF